MMTIQLSLFDEQQPMMVVADTWRKSLADCAAFLGTEEVSRLARLSRGSAMAELRVTHRWTLQAIANLVGLSRERVRQLTPPIEGDGVNPFINGNGGKAQVDGPRPVSDKDKTRVLQLAVRSLEAWCMGRLSKSWTIQQLGYEPDWNFSTTSKLPIIFRYGLGLVTRTQMHQWITEMYYEKGMSYASMTRWLSRRFVPIAPMTVHRFVTRELGFQGRGVGRRVIKQEEKE